MVSSQIKAHTCLRWFVLATVFVVGRIEPLCAQVTANPDLSKSDGSVSESAVTSHHGTQKAVDTSRPITEKEALDARILAGTQKLIQLAEELKAEVAKSNRDTLSLGVMKKASEVEKQAHSLKEQMKNHE